MRRTTPRAAAPDTGVSAGLLVASGIVPGTFARSLSARSAVDQGIVTASPSPQRTVRNTTSGFGKPSFIVRMPTRKGSLPCPLLSADSYGSTGRPVIRPSEPPWYGLWH